LFFAQKDKDSM